MILLGRPTRPPRADSSQEETPARRRGKGFLWLAGDHRIHTQYSSDGKYRVGDQVRQGARHAMDWLVITDHGSGTHAKIGVEKVDPDILRLPGTDGNRGAVGARGAAVDPAGPAIDVVGDADPWRDLWFYSNPVWVLPS